MAPEVIVILASPEPEGVDVTAWTIKVVFPLALIWCAAVLIWCLFENGVL